MKKRNLIKLHIFGIITTIIIFCASCINVANTGDSDTDIQGKKDKRLREVNRILTPSDNLVDNFSFEMSTRSGDAAYWDVLTNGNFKNIAQEVVDSCTGACRGCFCNLCLDRPARTSVSVQSHLCSSPAFLNGRG